jgi:hypothetical protein
MTAEPTRHTQFASWHDPDAWMESMSGPRWDATLQEEAARLDRYTSKPAIQALIHKNRVAYAIEKDKSKPLPFLSSQGGVEITWNGQFYKSWKFKGTEEEHEVRDIVSVGNKVWCTVDVGQGAELLELQHWVKGKSKPVWTKKPVGPDIAILHNTCVYLGVKNKLIYHELYACDAATGDNVERLHTETSGYVNLSIERQPEGRIVFIRENSQELDCFTLSLTRKGTVQKLPSTKFEIPSHWQLPKGDYGIAFVWPCEGLLVTKQQGKRHVWKCGSNPPQCILEIPAGAVLFDPFATYEGQSSCLVRVEQPHLQTQYYTYTSHGHALVLTQAVLPTGLKTERFSAVSSIDNTPVYGVVTYQADAAPTKLLVIGYGAYGMPTAVGSVIQRWAPLVLNGWCIAHTFIRGGGDHTDDWGKEGRRGGRVKTLSDFRALVRAAQHRLHISAKHTVIYGRSAGGLVMGGTLAAHPDGSLMGGVYTEVPYVDELRTTTNLSLPLTTLEFNEFGAPHMRLEDFISVGRLSPADSAAVIETPRVFVLSRTAENDSQVFAYESVKWIRRLRKRGPKGAPKLCIVERGQGHFTPPDLTQAQWALDTALLEAWVEGSLTTH